MNSMELSNYLEKVRIGRKMTQETLLDGIVSTRQYQRYRNGEGDIPYEKIELFAQKLGIPSRKLLNEFEKEKNYQLELINAFYNAVVNRDQEKVRQLEQKINADIIIEEEKKMYFKHAQTVRDWYDKRITEAEAFRRNADLINYPNILKRQYFTDIEILILSSLIEQLNLKDQEPLLNRLNELFDSEDSIMSADNPMVYTMILRRMIKTQGIRKNYSEVIKLCNLGLRRGIAIKQYYLFEYFYYYKALAYFELEDFYNYEDSLFRCYAVLHMENNQQKTDKFTKAIEKDFKINFDMVVLKYLQKSMR